MTTATRITALESEIQELTARLNALESEKLAAILEKLEALGTAKPAPKTVAHPAYQAPGAAARRAHMDAEIAFRRSWCQEHPGFSQDEVKAAIAAWNSEQQAAA